MTAPAWQPQAACNDYPTDLWFPPRGDTGVDAKRVCVTCPVRLDCLWDRLERGDQGFEGGIRGGHGGAVTRHLRRLMVTPPAPAWDGAWWTFIAFVAAVTVYGERLEVEAVNGRAPAGGPNRNGPTASCGTYASYVRKCRCRLCCAARDFHTVELSYRRLERERAA